MNTSWTWMVCGIWMVAASKTMGLPLELCTTFDFSTDCTATFLFENVPSANTTGDAIASHFSLYVEEHYRGPPHDLSPRFSDATILNSSPSGAVITEIYVQHGTGLDWGSRAASEDWAHHGKPLPGDFSDGVSQGFVLSYKDYIIPPSEGIGNGQFVELHQDLGGGRLEALLRGENRIGILVEKIDGSGRDVYWNSLTPVPDATSTFGSLGWICLLLLGFFSPSRGGRDVSVELE